MIDFDIIMTKVFNFNFKIYIVSVEYSTVSLANKKTEWMKVLNEFGFVF